jgi:hypothetical protein
VAPDEREDGAGTVRGSLAVFLPYVSDASCIEVIAARFDILQLELATASLVAVLG